MARASKASTSKKSGAKKSAGAAKKKTAATKASKATKGSSAEKKASAKKTAAKKAAPAKKAPAKKAAAQKSTSSGRARKGRSPFDTRFLEQMRKSLIAERETYTRQAAQLKAEAESLVADLDPGDVQFDEESGEGDTIAVERNRDLALAAKALEMIEEIDHALSKFDEGTYGICEISGEPIPKERLEAIPWAREKVEYKVGGFGRR